jgi:hypothetical protein
MACLMKFGSLPLAANPDHSTSEEAAATRKKVAAYQTVFDAHSTDGSHHADHGGGAVRRNPISVGGFP